MGELWEPYSLFPMFWIEEFADLDAAYKDKLDNMLTKPLNIVDAVQWTMVSSCDDFKYPNNPIYCNI